MGESAVQRRIDTGVPALDGILRGGIPEQRTVLLRGGPGTGKSTLAMQFLQAGLNRNQRCLFASTEQTPAELRDSFEPYAFDLDHPLLSVASVHATPGQTLESTEEMLTLDTLTDGTTADRARTAAEAEGTGGSGGEFGFGEVDEANGAGSEFGGFNRPFTSSYVLDYLRTYISCERVVFDSLSGLAPAADDERVFRRLVLVRLFSDEFEATTVFTAEETAGVDTIGSAENLRYNTHGVVRLWRERVEGDYHRFLEVEKMRGVDHATRSFEIEIDEDGVQVLPLSRTPSTVFSEDDCLRTGVTGLDKLCGGGLIRGGTALLEHDGRASLDLLVTNTITQAVRQGEAIVILPPSSLDPARLDQMISERVGSVDSLLANDQLFVLDLTGNWEGYDRNVFTIKEYEQRLRRLFGGLKLLVGWKMRNIFQTMNERRGDRSALAVVFTEAMLQEFNPTEVRQMYYWARKNLFIPEDTVLFVQNPGVMQETLAEFFVYDARQMLRTWVHDNGMQYLKLEKSPIGHLGSTRLVEHVNYPPYVRVQRPHGTARESAIRPRRQ